jgi:hypothetical protein
MVKKSTKPKRRMSTVLSDLTGPECFANEAGWRDYQEILSKLRMRALEQVMDGEEIHPSHGFNYRQPTRRQGHGQEVRTS